MVRKDIREDGREMRVDWRPVNPKLVIRMFAKLVVPPLGI